ncbi:caspase family protein [Streptomyces sp. NPDC060028]|uniref:caspase, EACC1-associated type n=1 Tax=Streptomyces sp. NPDC060028 TaxID=3347041 RepID=UPI0036746305
MTLPNPQASRAVLIGVGDYTHLPKLTTVRQNIAALAQILTSKTSWNLPPENCITVHDPKTPEDLVDPVHQGAQEATDALLVYYAGHGLRGDSRGEFRLTRSTSRSGAPHTSTDYNDVRETLLNSSAATRIVILDCCYAATALGVMSDPTSLAEEASIEGTYLIAAAGETQAAMADNGHGFTVFTGELVGLLRNGVPDKTRRFIDLDSTYSHLLQSLRSKARPLPHRRVRDSPGRLALSLNKQWSDKESFPNATSADTALEIRLEATSAPLEDGQSPTAPPAVRASPSTGQPQAEPLPSSITRDSGAAIATVGTCLEAGAQSEAPSEAPPATWASPGAQQTLGNVAQVHPGRRVPRTLSELSEFWPEILEAVKGHRRFAWIALSHYAKVTEFDGTRVVLEFDTKAHSDSYLEAKADKSLEHVVREVLTLPWVIEMRTKSAASPTVPRPQWSHNAGEWPTSRKFADIHDVAPLGSNLTRELAEHRLADPSVVDRSWAAVLVEVEKRRRFAFILLNSYAKLEYFGEYTVLLMFANESAFRNYNSSGVHQLLEATLLEIFQRPYHVEACTSSGCVNF